MPDLNLLVSNIIQHRKRILCSTDAAQDLAGLGLGHLAKEAVQMAEAVVLALEVGVALVEADGASATALLARIFALAPRAAIPTRTTARLRAVAFALALAAGVAGDRRVVIIIPVAIAIVTACITSRAATTVAAALREPGR